MDALFFRCLVPALARALTGARCRKMAFPAPGLFSLGLSGVPSLPETGGTVAKFMHGRTGPGRFFLFLSEHKPTLPAAPPAQAMWFRKRLADRRILGVLGDWPTRRLALCLSQGEGRFFVIDAKAGLSLVDALPDDFGAEPEWPDLEAVRGDPDIWQRHPQISPRLRKALAGLSPEAAAEAYAAVRAGEPDGYYVVRPAAPAGEDAPAMPLDVVCRRVPPAPRDAVLTPFPDPLAAAAAFAGPHFFPRAGGDADTKAAADTLRTARRKSRALARLDEDQARLAAMVDEGIFAEAMAACPRDLDPRAHVASLTLVHPEKGEMTRALDPRLTVRQNMTRFFERAAKGRRGLAVVAARREALSDPDRPYDPLAGFPRRAPAAPPSRPDPAKSAPPPDRWRGIPAHVYRTTDGFVVLRGKNARANEALLRQAASPFDYWFHVAGGPGSHVILRRDHPGREVPRQSLIEAATLAALASWRAGDAKAEVLVALVKDVRRGTGFRPGQVQVERLLETVVVDLRPEWESALRQA